MGAVVVGNILRAFYHGPAPVYRQSALVVIVRADKDNKALTQLPVAFR